MKNVVGMSSSDHFTIALGIKQSSMRVVLPKYFLKMEFLKFRLY